MVLLFISLTNTAGGEVGKCFRQVGMGSLLQLADILVALVRLLPQKKCIVYFPSDPWQYFG